MALFAMATQATANITGYWTTIDDETKEAKSVVQVYEYQGKYYGKVVELLKNPGAKAKIKGSPAIKGLTIIWDLEKDGDRPGLFKEIRSHFGKELGFIRQLPTIMETEHFYFVHGGLPHEKIRELEEINPFSLLKNDDYLNKGLSFSKWQVVGHWPVALYQKDILQHGPVMDEKRKILSIDGGCGVRGDGQLNLVITDWEGKDFRHLSATDKPKIRALDGQLPSAISRNIRWHDPVVELVRKEEKWATVRHHGYEMKIPIHFLQGDEKEWRCYNLTDYRLPVSAGDEMDLIFEHDGVAYCKKKDVCGWYEGRYQMIKETEK